jgi:hypothetical protein
MSTYTFSGSDTYSVADVKAVMQNTFEDIVGFANRDMVSFDDAKKWINDLTYILNQKALDFFELQLYNGLIRFKSYRYKVETNGMVSAGDQSGGINYFGIPSSTKVFLFAELKKDSPNHGSVVNELCNNRRWGSDGSQMTGTATMERNYVSNALQLNRSVIS